MIDTTGRTRGEGDATDEQLAACETDLPMTRLAIATSNYQAGGHNALRPRVIASPDAPPPATTTRHRRDRHLTRRNPQSRSSATAATSPHRKSHHA